MSTDQALEAAWGDAVQLEAAWDGSLELDAGWGDTVELDADLYVTTLSIPALGIALKQGGRLKLRQGGILKRRGS